MSLIYCACGCNTLFGEFDNRGRIRKYIYKHNVNGIHNPFYGKQHTEEYKQIMSLVHRSVSQETKDKMSKSHIGKPSLKKGKHYTDKNNIRISRAKYKAKRKRQLGYIPLNSCREDGWVGHHIDENYVIFIPEELHKSIKHSVLKNYNMNVINDLGYEWFIKYYLGVKL